MLLRDVGGDHLASRLGDVLVASEHRRGVGLVDDGLHQAGLALHAPEVAAGGVAAAARVPHGVRAVEMLTRAFRYPAALAAVVVRRASALGDRIVHIDRDPAHGVDEIHQSVDVHQDEIVDLLPGDALEGPLQGVCAGVIGVLEQFGIHGGRVLPDRAEEGVRAIVEAVGEDRGQRRVCREYRILQIARQLDEQGRTGLGVDRGHHHGVGPHTEVGLASLTGIATCQQNIDPVLVGPRVVLLERGTGLRLRVVLRAEQIAGQPGSLERVRRCDSERGAHDEGEQPNHHTTDGALPGGHPTRARDQVRADDDRDPDRGDRDQGEGDRPHPTGLQGASSGEHGIAKDHDPEHHGCGNDQGEQ